MTHTQLSIRVVGLVHPYTISEGDVVALRDVDHETPSKGRHPTWPLMAWVG